MSGSRMSVQEFESHQHRKNFTRSISFKPRHFPKFTSKSQHHSLLTVDLNYVPNSKCRLIVQE